MGETNKGLEYRVETGEQGGKEGSQGALTFGDPFLLMTAVKSGSYTHDLRT